ncbi:hypothetical protein SLS55_007113 [Diplodia seriata]|uniref:Heterokaryon incompatibility domain-containing protein n=1 Tax=Diplodia seriata TaxID=420778 RepID=A0ABR3CBB9_9PEZI
MLQQTEAQPETASGLARPADHRPLESGNTIKLAVLHPGTSSDTLSCDLITCALDQPPDYEALSYTWADGHGDSALTQSIRCSHGKIPITKNLEAALLRLRLADAPRFLWVDALCVDRSRVRERSHQVRLMPRIYRAASRVVVWLGERSFASDRLFDYLNGPGTDGATTTTEGEAVELLTRDLLKRRGWFRRLWALQEIVVARAAVVVCGDRTTRWQTLSKFFFSESVAAGVDEPPPPPPLIGQAGAAQFWDTRHPAAMMLCGGLQGPQPVDVLPTLLRACWALRTSEPLDRIFAVVGLVDVDVENAADGFVPDYGKTVFENLYGLAVYLLRNFHIVFPPGPWVLNDIVKCAAGSSASPPHTWIYRWNESRDPGTPVYLANDAVVDGHFLTIRGQKMLKGFFELAEEPLPLMRFRLDGDRIYEVSRGTVMVLDEAPKPSNEYVGFIAVKVSEISGVILRGSAASDTFSLIAGFTNPRKSRTTASDESSASTPQADWLEDMRSFTIS